MQAVIASVPARPFALPGARAFTVAAPGGDRYRVDVHVPAGDPPGGGWPALLLLDGWGAFGSAVEAAARMARRPDATAVGATAVIAISGADGGYDEARRRRDFTTAGADGGGGDAGAFLDLLTRRLVPAALAGTRIDPARIGLFGHSLAGFFCLWALRERPAAFAAHVAVSPSIWWDPAALAPMPAGAEDRGYVLILAGGWEDELPPWQAASPGAVEVRARRAARGMVAAARAQAAGLAAAIGRERVDFRLLEEEDHASIVGAAIPRALRLVARAAAAAADGEMETRR